jgi:hypothetical protein
MVYRRIPEVERYLENLAAMRILYRTSRRFRPPSESDLVWRRGAVEELLGKAGRKPWLLLLPDEEKYRDAADAFHFSLGSVRRGELSLLIEGAEHYRMRFEENAAILVSSSCIEPIMVPYDAAPRIFFLNPYYSIRMVAQIKKKEAAAQVPA